jgi:hypothetical protein
MNTRTFALIISFAWTGVAISSAAPAHAIAIATLGPYDYANCSAHSEAISLEVCGYYFAYQQTIKFVGAPCNGGACDDDPGGVYTDFEYASGRKVVSAVGECFAYQLGAYELGSCSC